MTATLAENKTASLLGRLTQIVGPDGLISSPAELMVYECDGYTMEKNRPEVVVFPRSTEEIVGVVKVCNELGVPFLPRGSGTSLAGGCLPVGGGVIISLARMRKILEVDIRNRYALVEPGVINMWLTNRVKGDGWHYAPDPSSQGACTIGGNVATNSGGPHTLKYGVTVNHILGVELVLPDGRVIQIGGPVEEAPGYDLTGLVVGSEGTFGVVSKVWVRLVRNPQSVRTLLGIFESIDDATMTISEIIGAGIVPAALEMLDNLILGAVEEAFGFGFPLDAGAVLIMEVDGLEAGIDDEAARIEAIALKNKARKVSRANTEAERMLLWKSRKQAFGAVGRLAPSYCTQDGVVPRTRLPEMLRIMHEISKRHDIRIANIFHAGDGNMHPILLFDERDPSQVQRVMEASHEILDTCLKLGGSVTGEHGIGVEKIDFMPKLFSPDDLMAMTRVRQAFNPSGLCSPGKMLPTAGACSEPSSARPLKPGRRAPH